MIPTPAQTGCLVARVNVDDAIVIQNELKFGPESLFTDVQFFARGKGVSETLTDESPEWQRKDAAKMRELTGAAEIREWIHSRMPSATVGSYHSSRFVITENHPADKFKVDSQVSRVPFEHYAPKERFADSELLLFEQDHFAGLHTVDFRQPAARAKLVGIIVDHAIQTGAKAIMTDEWAPSARWDGSVWFDDVLAYETQLTEALHRHGILHFVNAHFRVGGKNDFDGSGAPRLTKAQLRALAENCDCLLLERPCDPEAKPADIVADYQELAKTGTPCVLMGGSVEVMVGLCFLAAPADGVLNFVDCPVWKAEPEWKWWPAKYGKPDGSIKWKSATVAERKFKRGTIVVDFEKRTGG